MNYKKNKNKPLYRITEYGSKVLTPYGHHLQSTLFEYEKRVKILEREYLDLIYKNREIKALCQYKDSTIERQRAELKGKDQIITQTKAAPFDSDFSQWHSLISLTDVKTKFTEQATAVVCLADYAFSGVIKEFVMLKRYKNTWAVEKTSYTLEEYLKKTKTIIKYWRILVT